MLFRSKPAHAKSSFTFCGEPAFQLPSLGGEFLELRMNANGDEVTGSRAVIVHISREKSFTEANEGNEGAAELRRRLTSSTTTAFGVFAFLAAKLPRPPDS